MAAPVGTPDSQSNLDCGPSSEPLDSTNPTRPAVRIPKHTSWDRDQLILGKLSTSTFDVEEFRGIPYGTVSRRWEHSLLRTSLPTDVFDASHHGPKCPQPAAPNNSGIYQSHVDFPEVGESETECLNLFIVRPSRSALSVAGYNTVKTSLPVYFYIHGGAFGFGAGTDPMWNPVRLVQHSLAICKPFIAVVINYRLNIFGFAATSSLITAQKDSRLKGCNFGLHDQKIALKWVAKNISSFGGDPERITLGGQSAGGCSVHTHVLEAERTPEPPLFARALVQSGAFTSVGIGPIPLEACDKRWFDLYEYFGLTGHGECERLEVLRTMPAADLLRAVGLLGWTIFSLVNDDLTVKALSNGEWLVRFDQQDDGESSQVSKPAEPIQVLMGYAESEGSLFIAGALPKLQSYKEILAIFKQCYISEPAAISVLQTYGMEPSASTSTLHHGLIQYITDVTFGYSIFSGYEDLKGDRNHSHKSREPKDYPLPSRRPTTAHLYQVRFGNPFDGPSFEIAHHCVDLIYIFDAFHDALQKQDEQDDPKIATISNSDLRRDMQTTWVNFIAGDVKSAQEDAVVVWGKDRSVKIESLCDDPKWMAQRRKFDLIAAHRSEASLVMNSIFELAR